MTLGPGCRWVPSAAGVRRQAGRQGAPPASGFRALSLHPGRRHNFLGCKQLSSAPGYLRPPETEASGVGAGLGDVSVFHLWVPVAPGTSSLGQGQLQDSRVQPPTQFSKRSQRGGASFPAQVTCYSHWSVTGKSRGLGLPTTLLSTCVAPGSQAPPPLPPQPHPPRKCILDS